MTRTRASVCVLLYLSTLAGTYLYARSSFPPSFPPSLPRPISNTQDLNMETLLEEYALDDDEMGLDFLDGTNISDTSKDTAPNNVSDVRV